MAGQGGTPTNIKLGIAKIIYGGTELGFTNGDTAVTITHQQADIMVDQYGETPLDVYDIGVQITVAVPLTELAIGNLGVAIPGSSTAAGKVKVGRNAGTKLTAQQLVLDTLNSVDLNLIVYRAVVGEVDDYIYNNEQRTWTVTFKGLIDNDRPDGDKLFRFGGAAS
jgi:hypothetical protein